MSPATGLESFFCRGNYKYVAPNGAIFVTSARLLVEDRAIGSTLHRGFIKTTVYAGLTFEKKHKIRAEQQ